MNLLVRHGPAPGDTEDAAGRLHATFTGFFLLPLSADDTRAMFGTDGTDGSDPDAFIDLVRQIWQRVTAAEADGGLGDGHILIGAYSGFEYVINGPAACGFQLGTSTGGIPFAPKDYVPLYAVARSKKPADHEEAPGQPPAPAHIDLAVDYRNTSGPGDPAIRPAVFAVGS